MQELDEPLVKDVKVLFLKILFGLLSWFNFFEEMSNVTSILYVPEFFQKLVVRCLGLVVKYKLSPEFAPAAEVGYSESADNIATDVPFDVSKDY
ncbi:GM23421 [Drosophila sechellia]|uniref:GM23421 n=1 Tax=Drosophila sechellia TaxID=7238 RepID=B4ILW6_DROSE|nr:GM23421 [Drosophila sechellia]